MRYPVFDMHACRPVILGATTLALATGCATGRSASPAGPATPSQVVAIGSGDRLYYNDGSALTDSLRLVIRTQAEWADVWHRINANRSSPPAPPPVDFTKEMLLVAAAGRMSPGDQVRIDSVGRGAKNRTITVSIRTTVECHPFPGDSYPLEVVRIPKSDGRVVFVEKRVKPDCS